MLKWLDSRVMGKKAQFFIISTVILAMFLTVISNDLGGYASINTAEIPEKDEGLIFNNLKDQIKVTIESNDCPEVDNRLEGFRNNVKEDLRSRNIDFEMDYSFDVDPCSDTVTVSMNITSSDMHIRDSFTHS